MEKIFNFDENLEIIGVNTELFFEISITTRNLTIFDH